MNNDFKESQDFCVTLTYSYSSDYVGTPASTCFIIKGADVTRDKAEQVSEILFPNFYDIRVESVKNDDITLTYMDYNLLYNMVNDILVSYIKRTRILYQDIKDPQMVMYKNLCEKMIRRKKQFSAGWC